MELVGGGWIWDVACELLAVGLVTSVGTTFVEFWLLDWVNVGFWGVGVGVEDWLDKGKEMMGSLIELLLNDWDPNNKEFEDPFWLLAVDGTGEGLVWKKGLFVWRLLEGSGAWNWGIIFGGEEFVWFWRVRSY